METAKRVYIDSEIVNMDGYTEVFPEYSGRKHGRENIYIAACHHVTFEGLLAVSWRDKLYINDTVDAFD